ncbi:MAG: short-chain dehydrogenase, partial [Pseudoclavibacter sp.]
SKLYVTALTAALADRWPDTVVSVVDPGWMPTRMGGPNAPGDLQLGHDTQDWLATSLELDALRSGEYWHYRSIREPHPAARDAAFQSRMLEALARETGVELPR